MSEAAIDAQRRGADGRPWAAELALAVLISLAGLGLRAAYPSRLAVEHFDEGVYASNIFFEQQRSRGHYPDQHLYAPPLLPLLIELSMVAVGPSNLAAMLVSIAAGTLTVPLVWWVGRRWFGPMAGIAAAALLALNDAHIFFSRTALTDVLLCFFLLAAVYLFHQALMTRNLLALIGAGATTGLAWWTKYSGWLPLAIGLAALVPWCVFKRARPADGPGKLPRSRRLAVALSKWAIVALIASLAWSSWLWSLQAKGGYAAVRANHAGYYVDGFSGWCDSLSQQWLKLRELDGWPALHAPVFALLACLVLMCAQSRRSTWNVLLENRLLLLAMPVALGLSLAVGSAAVLLLLSLAGLIWLAERLRNDHAAELNRDRRGLAGWIVTAWLIGLLVSTPLYTPYPRLALPWLVASILGAGLAAHLAVTRDPMPGEALEAATDRTADPLMAALDPALSARRSSVSVLVLVSAAALAAMEPRALRYGVPGWEPRTGLAQAVPKIVAPMRSMASSGGTAQLDEFIVYCYGEPALFFQLRLAGVRWVGPVQNLGFADEQAPKPGSPTFLVFGTRARLTPGFADQLVDRRDRLQFVMWVLGVPSSKLVRLDGRADDGPERRDVLELYEFQ